MRITVLMLESMRMPFIRPVAADTMNVPTIEIVTIARSMFDGRRVAARRGLHKPLGRQARPAGRARRHPNPEGARRGHSCVRALTAARLQPDYGQRSCFRPQVEQDAIHGKSSQDIELRPDLRFASGPGTGLESFLPTMSLSTVIGLPWRSSMV